MKVLSPSNTNHQLVLIPRYYDVAESAVMDLYNEETKETSSIEIGSMNIINGFMYVDFEKQFLNNSNYQILIHEDAKVIYRGKLFITDQSDALQEYKITKDVFTL